MDRIIQVGNIVDDEHIHFKNPQRGRVYSAEGIAPAMCNFSGGGGLQPKIIVDDERENEIAGNLKVKGWHNKACEILDIGGVSTCIHCQSNNLLQK